MNLIDNDVNKIKAQNTKLIKTISIVIIILILITIGLISYLTYRKSKELKYILNGKSQTFSSDLFYFDDNNELYISIKDLSNLLQKNKIMAEYNNGRYEEYNEDTTKCYIKQNFETAGYEQNSKKMYKVIDEEGTYEYFTLDKPVEATNGKLYTTKKGIEIGFNIIIEFDNNKNSIYMYTLDNLAEIYAKSLSNSIINSKEISFSNKKALKYDMAIVCNSSKLYGVQRISNGEMIIGTKYSDLKFIENTMDFIVTTPDKKQGIISVVKGKDIEPQYMEIKQLKDDLNLYLIQNDKGKYGVYNREKQKNIIYPEYDFIGIEVDKFKNEKFENQYVLYENCIPCKKSIDGINKWELIDINGKKIIDQQFDEIGYVKGTGKNLKGENLLLIPEIESIIINKDSMYGIVNSTGKLLVKIAMQQIYAESSEGKNTYYMVYNDQTLDVLESLKKANVTVKDSSQTKDSENKTNNVNNSKSNTVNNENKTNTNTSTNTNVNNSSNTNSTNSTKKNETNVN